MTKEELIDKIAPGARLSKADAARAINATIMTSSAFGFIAARRALKERQI
jgi:nucleoid DNA-binding protein